MPGVDVVMMSVLDDPWYDVLALASTATASRVTQAYRNPSPYRIQLTYTMLL